MCPILVKECQMMYFEKVYQDRISPRISRVYNTTNRGERGGSVKAYRVGGRPSVANDDPCPRPTSTNTDIQ